MNIRNLMSTVALTAGILISGSMAQAQYAQGPPPPPGAYNQGPGGPGGWDAPPQEYQNDMQRRGFHDGIEGARKDFENHRQPNVNNRDEFRHPNVPRGARRAYKEGFRRGYDVGVSHMMGGRGPDHYR